MRWRVMGDPVDGRMPASAVVLASVNQNQCGSVRAHQVVALAKEIDTVRVRFRCDTCPFEFLSCGSSDPCVSTPRMPAHATNLSATLMALVGLRRSRLAGHQLFTAPRGPSASALLAGCQQCPTVMMPRGRPRAAVLNRRRYRLELHVLAWPRLRPPASIV